jgi:hypothetical protein
MDETQLKTELDDIRCGMRWIDSIVETDYKTGEGKLNKEQVEIVKKMFKIFSVLNWQLAFNSYKELKYADSKPIDLRKCGTPVKIRSCREEHGTKTYFGILLGELALGIGHSIDSVGTVTATHQHYNPAIFVPELNTIVYGMESWWGEIKSQEEMEKVIDDITIENVWYVQMLKKLCTANPE